MWSIFEIGEQVQIDCSPESKALPGLKKKLEGRAGEILSECREMGTGMPFDYTVRFPRVGRKAEVVLDLHFSILLKTQQQN